jgi:hypothetical protein
MIFILHVNKDYVYVFIPQITLHEASDLFLREIIILSNNFKKILVLTKKNIPKLKLN